MENEKEILENEKDFAYYERNQLVALMSKVFPSKIGKHEGEDWASDWRNVIYMELPTGQVSWHIHDSELKYFTHLENDPFVKWDGHSTEEKYRRIGAIKQMASKVFSYNPDVYKDYKENPKTKGSGIYGCIPQKGRCPQNCADCFFQSGRSYLEPLDENTPNMPDPLEMMDRVVRINDGNDSNNNKALVMEKSSVYRLKFYNTSFPARLEAFDAPVVLTVNPSGMTDTEFYKLDHIPENLMFVRVRVNMWNLEMVDRAVKYYSDRNVPIVLTFMAYYTESVPEKYKKYYEFKKRTLNSYWCLTEPAWRFIEDRYRRNKWVDICGKYGATSCKFCGNCLKHFFSTEERLAEDRV